LYFLNNDYSLAHHHRWASCLLGENARRKIPLIMEPIVSRKNEADLIYDKEIKCPVCDKKFITKVMKSSKTRLIGTDDDLRPRYEGIESQKYDVILCENCGYAALAKNFTEVFPTQIKMIKENICGSVKVTEYSEPTYSFEQAEERYKLALACAVVKRGKSSERALISLKSAWLFRAHYEAIIADGGEAKQVEALKARENEYLESAYRGFLAAREKESYPIAGMDPYTLDYLIARLAIRFEEYDCASKLISGILVSTCSERIKDKARSLKEEFKK